MSGAQDPEYDAIVEAAESAATREEMQRLVREADRYYIKQQWDSMGSATASISIYPAVAGRLQR